MKPKAHLFGVLHRLLLCAFILLSATFNVTHAHDSHGHNFKHGHDLAPGLRAIGPYAFANDVCQVLMLTPSIVVYHEYGHRLVACPKHELGAIAARQREGAVMVAQVAHWVIFRVR